MGKGWFPTSKGAVPFTFSNFENNRAESLEDINTHYITASKSIKINISKNPFEKINQKIKILRKKGR